jgi:dipeptidyl aminopeptidase/acylaminoacyl peptidase
MVAIRNDSPKRRLEPAPNRPRQATAAMTPEIIRHQVVLEEMDVSPDGRFAIVVRRAVGRADRYVSQLWLVPLVTGLGRVRPITAGFVRDSRPRISPDSRRVAFRRRRHDSAGAVPTLEVLDLPGPGSGDPAADSWTLAAPVHGVEAVAWSPGGDRLAFTTETDPTRFLIPEPGRTRTGPDPDRSPLGRRIDRADWRYDDQGHVDRWEHLFAVAVRRNARPRRLTSGDWGVLQPSWDPDGQSLVFAADRSDQADRRPRLTIWRVGLDASEPVEILVLGGNASQPAISPDGRWLAAVGVVDEEPLDDQSPGIVIAPADGSGPAVALAPELDRPLGSWVDTDLQGWQVSARPGPFWAGSNRLVALLSDRGRCLPWQFELDPATGRSSTPPRPLAADAAACDHLAVAREGRRVAVIGTLDGRAPELMTAADGRLVTRTTMGSRWQAGVRQPEMRLVLAPGAGGPIETWIASPPGAGDALLPAVVDIHGGPLGAWAPAPSLEVALLVSRGYRVILPNIRGSATYGRDWIRPQLGDWGGVDADDVHAVLDHVIGLGLVDGGRLGVLGLSYGGFMVNWLVGTSSRFGAAVSENGVANQVSAWSNSDSGPDYCRTSLLGDPFSEAGMLKLWRQSPLAHVSAVRTPLLILQGEADERCPKADNEQFFIALRMLGRTVEYVLYPDEYHVYQASGRVDRRIDRMTRMLDWFDRHLGRQGNPAGSSAG